MFYVIYVRMYLCIYMCLYVRTFVCMYVCMYVCIYVCVFMYIGVCLNMLVVGGPCNEGALKYLSWAPCCSFEAL